MHWFFLWVHHLVMRNESGKYISEGKLDNWLVNHKNIGAMTNVIVASILIRTWSEGPAVSLNGSPTLKRNTHILL
jgi:hypothetical protein